MTLAAAAPKTGIVVHVDPHEPVECAQCDRLGRPRGGVRTERHDNRVHISFALPEGWALRGATLLCGVCAPRSS